jgi:hypothetical protein
LTPWVLHIPPPRPIVAAEAAYTKLHVDSTNQHRKLRRGVHRGAFVRCCMEPWRLASAVLRLSLTLWHLRFPGGDYEQRSTLGYKYLVRTSYETHYISATQPSRLMLCNIWGFHDGDYEWSRLLGYKNPVRTSQETQYVSATESSQLKLCKIWSFHGGDYEDVEPCESCKNRLFGGTHRFIIWLKRISELRTTLAVTINWRTLIVTATLFYLRDSFYSDDGHTVLKRDTHPKGRHPFFFTLFQKHSILHSTAKINKHFLNIFCQKMQHLRSPLRIILSSTRH